MPNHPRTSATGQRSVLSRIVSCSTKLSKEDSIYTRILLFRQQNPTPSSISAENLRYCLRCQTKECHCASPVIPAVVPVISNDQKVYEHYSAFCRTVAHIEPTSIVDWDAARASQVPTANSVEHPYKVDLYRDDDFIGWHKFFYSQTYGSPRERAEAFGKVFDRFKTDVTARCKWCHCHVEKEAGLVKYRYCELCRDVLNDLEEVRCLSEVAHPITFDMHVARATSLPFIRKQIVPAATKGPGSLFIPTRVLEVKPRKWWCPQCTEHVTLTTIGDLKVTFDRPGKYASKDHECDDNLRVQACIDHQIVSRWLYNTESITLYTTRKSVARFLPNPTDKPHGYREVCQSGRIPHREPNRLGILRFKITARRAEVDGERYQSFIDQYQQWCTSTKYCKHGLLNDDSCVLCATTKYVPVVDFLRDATLCTHRNLRSFPFSTGERITLCPDCGYQQGHKVLKERRFESAANIVNNHWNNQLEFFGLPTEKELGAEDYLLSNKPAWDFERQSAEDDRTVTPVTVDGADTESDRTIDRSSRDYRADKIWKEAEHVMPTQSQCILCGDEFYDRAGTLHCSDNHRKRWSEIQQKDWEIVRRSVRVLSKITQTHQWGLLSTITIKTWFKRLWAEGIAACL
jgi:hypothetical protein